MSSVFPAAFQDGWENSGPWLGQHSHGGNQAPRRSAPGGAPAHPPEESGEPHHRGSALLPPPAALRCGPGVQRAVLHHPGGPLVEEERYCTLMLRGGKKKMMDAQVNTTHDDQYLQCRKMHVFKSFFDSSWNVFFLFLASFYCSGTSRMLLHTQTSSMQEQPVLLPCKLCCSQQSLDIVNNLQQVCTLLASLLPLLCYRRWSPAHN